MIQFFIIIIILGVLFFKYMKKSYKVYTAVITQKSGSNAPTEDYVLENTIGKLVYTWDSDGIYNIKLTGAFPENKVIIFSTKDFYGADIKWDRLDDDNIRLKQPRTNKSFSKLPIEIRVYN
jgi:hypothetical protein